MSAISMLSSFSNVDLGSRISVAVARKTLDEAESQGEAMVEMIRAAGEAGPASPRGALQQSPIGRGPISSKPSARETGRRLDLTA